MRSSAAGNKTGGTREPARARKSAAMRKFSAVRNPFGMSEQVMSVTVVDASDEGPAVGDVPVMVVYQVVVVPIGSPVMPAPAKAGEDANSHAERNPWPLDEGARNPDPPWIERERVPVDDPRIIFRHINDFRVRWFNHDRLSLSRDGLRLRAAAVPCLLRPLPPQLAVGKA